MKLIDNWREVLRKAWSVRFIVGAALLSGLEVALPIIQDQLTEANVIPRGSMALLAALVSAAALVARVKAQPEIKK